VGVGGRAGMKSRAKATKSLGDCGYVWCGAIRHAGPALRTVIDSMIWKMLDFCLQLWYDAR